MKHFLIITGLCALFPTALTAEEQAPAETLAKHKEGSVKVAEDQDELSADVQQLVIEQTVPKVIELFNEAEKIMDEATDRLDRADTGGETIAAQTEIIEKIFEAAKEKQKQKQGKGGESKPGGAMMDMMERMKDGEEPGDKEGKGKGKKGKGKGKGDKPGEEPGKGKTGLSDTANDATTGDGSGKSDARRVPKAGGSATLEIPEEFRKAFDAYNRGAEKKVK